MTRKRRPRGEGHVRVRNGKHLLVVTVAGKQYSRATPAATKRDALKALTLFKAEIQIGAVDAQRAAKTKADGAPTFTAAVERFLEREIGASQASTRRAYGKALQRAGKALCGKRVSEINRHEIREVLLAVNKESALNTTKLVHCALGRLFRNLVEDEVISASPVLSMKSLRLPNPGREKKRPIALTSDQLGALLAACEGDAELYVWTKVMVATGLRPGEALALTWRTVDFGAGTIKVRASVKDGTTRGQGVLGSVKTASSAREVPLGAVLAAALKKVYLERAALYQRVRPNLDIGLEDCLFPADLFTAAKVPRSLDALQAKFRAVSKRAGLPGISPHFLRHTFATAAIAGSDTSPGVSVADAAELLGHSNSAMVAKVYGHAVREGLVRGVALADALIAPKVPTTTNVTPIVAARVS